MELFRGLVQIKAGSRESSVFAVPAGIKRADVPLTIKVSLDAANFPAGTATVSVFISTDGGVSYRGATMTCVNPAQWSSPGQNFWTLQFSLGANDRPTHVKYVTDVPTGFTTQSVIEAV